MLGPQYFHQSMKCSYICMLFIYTIYSYIHINQLWIAQMPENGNKQLRSCMELVLMRSAYVTKFYSSECLCSRICNGLSW